MNRSRHIFPLTCIFLFVLFGVAAPPAFSAPARTKEECVILLHGLGRTSRSMSALEKALTKAGFFPVNLDYPSQDDAIENLSLSVIPQGLKACERHGASPVHFVTHSMGGILLRYFLVENSISDLGQVVMLSPPNQGSEVADALKDWSLYQWYNGPAGQQLGTDMESLVMKLGPVDYPVGIITGNEPAFFDFWLQDMIPGPGDGKVSVERAKVQGMSDFLVLPYSHTYIMEADEVIKQSIFFIRHQHFSRAIEQKNDQ